MTNYIWWPTAIALCLITAALVVYQSVNGTESDKPPKVHPLQLKPDEDVFSKEEKIQRRRLKSSPPLTIKNDPDRGYQERARAAPIRERIVGGVPSEPEAYPFYGHSTGSFLCGGTFVHEDILLTAAHCLDTFVEDVIVGSNDLFGRDEAERIPIDELFPHPDYNNVTEVNDIMLVKLESPSSATLVNWNVNEDLPIDEEDVKVIGFGQTSDGGMVSLELLEVQVDIIDFDTCSNLLAGLDLAEERVVCAADLAGGKDSCQGDSGGPLLSLDNVQYGLVSFGIGCGEPNRPAVYTRVSNYEEWIRQGICDLSANPPESCIAEETDVPTISPVAETTAPSVGGNETIAPTLSVTTTAPTAVVAPMTVAPTIDAQTTALPTTVTTDAPMSALPTTAVPTTAAPTQSTALPTTATTTIPPTTSAPVTETGSPSPQLTMPPTPQLETTQAPTMVTATAAPTPLISEEPSAVPVLLTLSPSQLSTQEPTGSPVSAPTRPPSTPTQAPVPVITPEPTVLATPSPTKASPVIPPLGLIPPPVRPPVPPPVTVMPTPPSKPTPPEYFPSGRGQGKGAVDFSYSYSYSHSKKSGKGKSKSSKSKKKSGKGPYYNYYRYYHAGSKGNYHQR